MSGTCAWRLGTVRLLLALAVALALAGYVPEYLGAQEPAPLPPPQPEPAPPVEPEPAGPEISPASELEAQARVFEGKGLYYEAVVTYREALIKAIELAEAAGQGEQAAKYWAEAEIYLDRTVSLMYQEPRPDYKDICIGLEKLGRDHKLPAVMDGWRQWQLAQALIGTGEIDRAKQACRELGFVTNWMIIGPFENERGGRFKHPYEPETELDIDAAYKGKKRRVHWRMLPVEPVLGEVNFDAMMRPNDQVLAYALAFIEVEKDTPAALRVGSDEGLRVWVNDQKVLDRDIHRPLGFDQDVMGVQLNKGLNKILVKVAERHGGWAFRLRITDPEGGKLAFKPLTTLAEFQKEFGEPTCKAATEKAEVEVTRGAIGYYEMMVKETHGDVIAQAHLGYLHLVHPFEDENAYEDRTAFEKCVELEPENPYYRFMLAEAYQLEMTRMEAEKEANKMRQAIEKAIELEPEYVEALCHMTRYYLEDMGNWHKAKDYLERALKVNPGYFRALLLALDILQARQFTMEAKLQTLALGKHPKEEIKTSPAVLWRLVNLYSRDGRPLKMVETLKALLEQNYADTGARTQLVNHLIEMGRLDEALAQYEILIGIGPYELSNYVQRAEIYEGRDKFEQAIAEIDRALGVCPEAEDELVKKGNLLMRLSLERGEDKTGELYARALALFEDILKRINPNNTWVKRYLEFLREEEKSYEEHERFAAEVSFVPEGDSSTAQLSTQEKGEQEKGEQASPGVYIKWKKLVLDESGEPVMEDGKQKLQESVVHFTSKELKAQAEKENLPWLCILSKQVANVRHDGTSSEFTHFVIRICNDQGTQQFRYFPCGAFMTAWRQEVKIKKARLIHEDGTEEEGRAMGWAVLFPPLKVGDILDVQFRVDDTITDLTERFFGDYYGNLHIFHNTFFLSRYSLEFAPIKLSQYYLMLPKERKFYFNHLSTEVRPAKEPGLDDKTELFVWELRELPHIVSEILMPPVEQFLPAVQISTFGDWKEFGKWFYNLVKKQYDMSPEIKEKVKELTEGKKTEFEKIRAIYNFVVTDIRYEAWTYGIHGWQPYKASTIFARKQGDCKDKSLLINTMLREVGIKSLPVLIYGTGTRGEPDMTLPMVRHFNHCIAYAPPSEERKEGIWMDGTAEFYSLGDRPPVMDWGAPTMVVDEDGGELINVPLPDPEENVQTESTVVELAADGTAKVKTVLTVDSDNASEVRRRFSVEGRREIVLGDLYGARFGGTKVTSVDFPDLKDLNIEPLTYRYELEIPDFVKKTSEGLTLEHDFFAVPWSRLTPQAERKRKMVLPYMLGLAPVMLPMPGTMQTNLTFVLPEGFKVVSVPKNEKFSSEFADFRLTFEKEEGEKVKVFVKKTVTYKMNNLSVEQYGKLRELTNLLESTQKEKVIIEGPQEQPGKEEQPKEEGPPKEGRKLPPEPPEDPGK